MLRQVGSARSVSGARLDCMAAEVFVMIYAGLDCLHYGVILSALHVIVSWRMEDGWQAVCPPLHDLV